MSILFIYYCYNKKSQAEYGLWVQVFQGYCLNNFWLSLHSKTIQLQFPYCLILEQQDWLYLFPYHWSRIFHNQNPDVFFIRTGSLFITSSPKTVCPFITVFNAGTIHSKFCFKIYPLVPFFKCILTIYSSSENVVRYSIFASLMLFKYFFLLLQFPSFQTYVYH